MGGAVSSGSTNDELVDNLVDGSCIRTRDVERAFRMVDRAEYFLPRSRNNAYKDVAWKSGHYHLSAPCVYSEVMEGLCLQPGNSFLNIGSGTGYLSTMAGLLLGTNGVNHGIEVHEDLVTYARHKLERFKKCAGALDEFEFCEPSFAVGNGLCLSHGKPGDFREYDRVYCGAACPEAFEAQVWRLVAVGGILVMPCNDQLLQLRRTAADTWDACPLLGVTFATLVPPLSDVEYTEQERKDHSRIAMSLFTVTPPSLQHLCRSQIRCTLRANVLAAHPSVYKCARKPAVHPKGSRRFPRSSATSTNAAAAPVESSVDEERQAAAATGTQRVTLSLGANGRLNIDRSGAETEASRRARSRLLGHRFLSARNSGVEGSGHEELTLVGRCAAVDATVERGDRNTNAALGNVGLTERLALAEAMGNYRVERLLEHLCQEMILEPIADGSEPPPQENNHSDVNECYHMLAELTNFESADTAAAAAAAAGDSSEEEPPKPSSSTETTDGVKKSLDDDRIIVEAELERSENHADDENMDTDSESEKTETENVSIDLNHYQLEQSSSTAQNANSTSPAKEPPTETAPAPPNPLRNKHRFAGFRFHNKPVLAGGSQSAATTTTTNNKRSSSNSSLKKSSKRRNNHANSQSATEYETASSTDSSSTSSVSTDEDSEDDDGSDEGNAGRRRLGRRAQIVHLYDISHRIEANNNLSTDEDEDTDDSSDRVSNFEGIDTNLPSLVVKSDYSAPMIARIRQLPLPRRLQLYVNYDRQLGDEEELDEGEE